MMYTEGAAYTFKAEKSPNLILSKLSTFYLYGLCFATSGIFFKYLYHIKRYKQLVFDVFLPPLSVFIRWATSKLRLQFSTVNVSKWNQWCKTFVLSCSAFDSSKVLSSVSYIASHFSWIPNSIKKLDISGMPLHEAVGLMEVAVQKVNIVPEEVACVVSTKLQTVLYKNPGYSTLLLVLIHFMGKSQNCQRTYSSTILLYKYTPLTSCEG